MHEINSQQCFDWAGLLTEQLTYQDLVFTFIEVLNSIPSIDKVTIFEVFGGKHQLKQGSVESDLLVRQFPVNITRPEQESPHSYLLENISKQINVVEIGDGSKALVAPITNSSGPDRIVLLQGDVEAARQVFSNLLRIFRNQIVLHDLKERDVLTCLLNRESLSVRLLEVSEFYRKEGRPILSTDKHSLVAILDIDHFKRVNDNFGHLYGDEVLLRFSQLMERKFRYIDYLFRFGGEEFVVILNNVTEDEALGILNRFRLEVETYEFPEVGKVTVSIGSTKITEKGELPSTLLDRADKALYFAKENGRNQSILFEHMRELTDNHADEADVELF